MNLTDSVLYPFPDLPHTAILTTPKPPTSASCFLKMILLPDSPIPCLYLPLGSLFRFYLSTTPTPQVFPSPFVCDCVGRLFERRLPSAVEPTGWRRRFSPKWECKLPRTYSQWCSIKPCWELYLTAASLRYGARTRTTVETLTGLMT